jgi:hypothetical protein
MEYSPLLTERMFCGDLKRKRQTEPKSARYRQILKEGSVSTLLYKSFQVPANS